MTRNMAYPNLSAEMARMEYTVEDLARALGIHPTGVYQILRGERNISISRAKRIRDQLFPGMSLEYLFEGKG